MEPAGLIEVMARADLDALVWEIGAAYEPGAIEALAAADPAWAEALDDAERRVGALYAVMREADAAVAAWPEAVAELSRVWRQVLDRPSDAVGAPDPLPEREAA